MNKVFIFICAAFLPISIAAQIIDKPLGCFAGTNGTHPDVLAHQEVRGVLLTEKWSEIEVLPGVYDFSGLDAKVNVVRDAGLKYALAIPAGAFGSPDWLIDFLGVEFHDFDYQGSDWRLPLWWDDVADQKLTELITQLGIHFAADSMLSHVYVSQMTVNGVEGHLNGVNMVDFESDGYTNQLWIDAATSTTIKFANAFPNKPIVFEVHEIGQDTLVAAAIMNELTHNSELCDRVGLGMWWISGKTEYQSDLLDYIHDFQGDIYAQIIGRSDQPERFLDSLYNTAFEQAKYLGVRYIEPWPFEFQHQTNDSLIHDFNEWADLHFSQSDTCFYLTNVSTQWNRNHELVIAPNPTKGFIELQFDSQYQEIEVVITNHTGVQVSRVRNQTRVDLGPFPEGIYIIHCFMDDLFLRKKVVKLD